VAALSSWRIAAGFGAALAVLVAAVAYSRSRPALAAGTPAAGRVTGTITTAQRVAIHGVGFSVFFTLGAMPNTLLPLIGASELRLSVSTIGLALGVGGLARLVSAVATGAISDRVSRRAALVPCQGVQILGVLLLAVDAGAGGWLAAIVLMSLGSSAHAVAATILTDRLSAADLGRSLGRYRFFADTGFVVGPVLSALLYQSGGREAAVTMVAGVLLAALVLSSLAVPKDVAVPKDMAVAEVAVPKDVAPGAGEAEVRAADEPMR
jgi:MFS family permease